jgi:LysM domain-containing protein
MPEYRPNRAARLAAVLALIGAFLVFIVLIATSGGGSDKDEGGGKGPQVERNGPTRQGQRAENRGVWIVHSGDTLAQISEETGIDVDELLQLNPDLDPQALLEGQRIALK